jgi:small subunit ribosomal protein S6
MKHYEQIFILKPTLTAEETTSRLEAIKDSITKNGGEILGFQDAGLRKLAYKVKKHSRGYYGVIYFKTNPSAIAEIERVLSISEDVIKYMTLKYESNKELKAFNDLVDHVNGKKKEEKRFTEESSEEDNSSNEDDKNEEN